MMRDDYPSTVIEVLEVENRFSTAVLEAVRAFARSKPWTGSLESRIKKFRILHHVLSEAHGIQVPDLIFKQINGGSSGGSYYEPGRHRIVLTGKMSVVTYLHEFAHALGMDEHGACRWSINLFRRCFPRECARLVHVGHTLVRPEDVGVELGKKSV